MTGRFIIYTFPRTGSNWLGSALGAHRDVSYYGEVMRSSDWSEEDDRVFGLFPDRFIPVDYRHRHPDEIYDAVFHRPGNARLTGIKLMLVLPPNVLEQSLRHRIDFSVLLTRENALASFASQRMAKLTGQGIVNVGETVLRKKVKFNVQEFERFCRSRNKRLDEARQFLPANTLEVTYDQLRREGFGAVSDYLGLTPLPPADTLKRSSDEILSRFSNPRDVEKHLSDIGREDWAIESS